MINQLLIDAEKTLQSSGNVDEVTIEKAMKALRSSRFLDIQHYDYLQNADNIAWLFYHYFELWRIGTGRDEQTPQNYHDALASFPYLEELLKFYEAGSVSESIANWGWNLIEACERIAASREPEAA